MLRQSLRDASAPVIEQRRTVETARGPFVLRLEAAEDEPFLFELFRANNIDVLHLMGLADTLVESLIRFQFRSQTATYRGMFPDAVFSILEQDGKSIGRLIEHDEQDIVYLVDFALVPERQSCGLGSVFMRAVMDDWATRGRGTRVKILVTNEPSRKLCRKVGMVEAESDDMAFVEMRWYPT